MLSDAKKKKEMTLPFTSEPGANIERIPQLMGCCNDKLVCTRCGYVMQEDSKISLAGSKNKSTKCPYCKTLVEFDSENGGE